jgi:hypothetical protein
MIFKPLFPFRSTTIARAFIINAILTGLITALTIEARRVLDLNKYTKDFPDRPHKLIFTALASILIGLLAYTLLRTLFGSGGGMLTSSHPYKSFF